MEMTIHEDLPRIPVRPTNPKATYVVEDTSGRGFGSSGWKAGETNVEAVYGSWKAEGFVFTDNSTAEKTMYRESSKSALLHNMVLDLRKIEMIGDIIVHFVWISRKRVI